MLGSTAVTRMDNVGVVVNDLAAAVAFFQELGLEPEGEAHVEGGTADRLVRLDGVRCDIALMRTPGGHGRIELMNFRKPTAPSALPDNAAPNTVGIRRVMFAVDNASELFPIRRAR